jgi:hypothetical protein
MQAVEFEADVKNFSINVPRRLSILEKKHVRLVALFENTTASRELSAKSFIGNMIANPLKIDGFTPLKRNDIYAR